MVTKEIKYTDFNGQEIVEKAYFNMTQYELSKFSLNYGNDENALQNYINKIVKENNNKASLQLIEDLIRSSYGQKDADGKRFVKNAAAAEEFLCSEAFSALFVELIQDENALNEFIMAIPSGVSTAQIKQAATLTNN